MDEKEILQLARDCGCIEPYQVNNQHIIAFANAMFNAGLERAAGIAEDWDSDSADPRDIAAAIRGAKG